MKTLYYRYENCSFRLTWSLTIKILIGQWVGVNVLMYHRCEILPVHPKIQRRITEPIMITDFTSFHSMTSRMPFSKSSIMIVSEMLLMFIFDCNWDRSLLICMIFKNFLKRSVMGFLHVSRVTPISFHTELLSEYSILCVLRNDMNLTEKGVFLAFNNLKLNGIFWLFR